ncbi:unnamed protein product [Arctia plantaginis]|uniref:MADF domain-containing protein n=1 Tax=Arctia plantaginis TaxID=874455 RepID=A0A8S1A6V3_ARCPL|nr:unnamed protein product [Arctia plantaginis]CAB3242183.1 unnamed protein product [Arctia plantaginis]
MPRDILSEQQCNIEFVKNVQKFPCLYNFELPSYTRKDISDKAWEEVAEAMNMTPSACRERWRNLRAVFMRTIKATGAGTKKKPYYLADVMQFIVPFLRPTTMTEAEKNKILNMELNRAENSRTKESESTASVEIALEEIKVESIDEDDTAQSGGPDWGVEITNSSRKRPPDVEEQYTTITKKRLSSVQTSAIGPLETSDPVTSFVNSLMPELKEMNSMQFKCFKRRVLVLIDDITSEIPNAPPHENDYIVFDNQ